MSKPNTRSPLTDKPLRQPGQSLDEERQRLWEDKLEPWALMALFFVLIAALEWWKAWTGTPPLPGLFTVVAACFVAFTAWRVRRALPRLRALRQGIDGEKAVGQFLERLHSQGYRVFHDLKGPTFNVDHVLIGPAGIFTIETKTWSKPLSGDARVTGDADGLLVAGHRPDRDPVVHARAQAGWLHRLLEESTGKSFAVRPVIVFPGWFVDPSAQRHAKLWILEPKALPAFLDREPACLLASDVALAGFHLSRFVRGGERG